MQPGLRSLFPANETSSVTVLRLHAGVAGAARARAARALRGARLAALLAGAARARQAPTRRHEAAALQPHPHRRSPFPHSPHSPCHTQPISQAMPFLVSFLHVEGRACFCLPGSRRDRCQITIQSLHAACMAVRLASACTAGEDIRQEMWLVAANAGFGTARDLATDARNARLHLDPTAAVAIRYTSDRDLELLPDPAGGELCFYSVSPASMAASMSLSSLRNAPLRLGWSWHCVSCRVPLHFTLNLSPSAGNMCSNNAGMIAGSRALWLLHRQASSGRSRCAGPARAFTTRSPSWCSEHSRRLRTARGDMCTPAPALTRLIRHADHAAARDQHCSPTTSRSDATSARCT